MFKKKFIIIGILSICLIAAILSINIVTKNVPINNIKIEKYNIDEDTINNLQTTEIEQQNETDEKNLEIESFEEQGNIEYNGSEETPVIKLGNYTGLVYYSQVDSRWKNNVYTSIGNTSQTIGNSGCGPTAAAMVVTATTGTITPPEVADIFVNYGFRSANSGTYWSAFRWIADVFDIKYEETSNVNNAIDLVKSGNYVVAPCGNGLFTYGGHYILIIGIEDDILQIYDPYLYNGKFDTSTRKGKVTVVNNTVYCSVENFKKYANARSFFAYEKNTIEENNSESIPSISENLNVSNYTVVTTAKSGLRIREGPGTNYKKVGLYQYNTQVTILEKNNGWGRTSEGWICLEYTNKLTTVTNSSTYSTGTYKVTCSKLNVRTGPGINYRKKSIYELTYNARKQGGYVRNVICTVYEVSGEWGRTPSGWICLKYCTKIR